MNLEKNFEEVSKLVQNYQAVLQQVEGSSFNAVEYIKKMRGIRQQLRKEMMKQGIADNTEQLRVAEPIRDLALELDRAMTVNSAQGNYVDEFNTAFQLYDLLNDYQPEPEREIK